MRINYITNVRLPTTRAQGYAIMKMCSEFTKAGAEVQLFVPERNGSLLKQDPFDFYGIAKAFDIKKVISFDFLGRTFRFGKLFYWIDILSFFISMKFRAVLNMEDFIYSRDYLTALFFPKNSVALEIHDIPDSLTLFRMAIKKVKLFFVLNNNLKNDLIEMGVMEDKIFIFPSGVELKDFDIEISKEEAREKLDLPIDKNIVVYTGHLYSWKGVETLADAGKQMPETHFVFVGGVEPELGKFVSKYKKYDNIIIRPSVERSLIPVYLKAADVLVLPNSAKEEISARYTSPLKLFEYMASGRPIVASRLSSITEILTENECIFAEPDNDQSFISSIKKMLEDRGLAIEIAQNALIKAKNHSWSERAIKIINIMEKHG